MKIQSAKQKGRKLQQWVVAQLKECFNFDDKDIRSTPMSVPGPDVMMSVQAQGVFPFAIECKAQERFKGLYDIFNKITAVDGTEGRGKLLFLKKNNEEPLVVMDGFLMIRLFASAYYLYAKHKESVNDQSDYPKPTVH